MTKKPMTVEEMFARWPKVPPYECNSIEFWRVDYESDKSPGSTAKIEFEVTQDTIQEVRDYLDAVEECLNG